MPRSVSRLIPASSFTRALDVIGDRWTLLILRDAFLGIRRFEQWQQHLRIARQILADRLRRLVAEGLLAKAPYQTHPPRYDYRLTDSGRGLYPLALTIRHWERRWGAGVDAIVGEMTLFHRSCSKRTEPRCVCGKCGETVTAEQVRFEDRSSEVGEPYLQPRRRRRSGAISSIPLSHGLFVHDAVDVLGDRWTYLVLIAVFHRTCHFTELCRTLGIATNILSDRLTRLTEAEILRHKVSLGTSDRHEYVLTEKGLDLFPVIVVLSQWGSRQFPDLHEPPSTIYHRFCGSRLRARIVCDNCGVALHSADVEYRRPRPVGRRTTKRKRQHRRALLEPDADSAMASSRVRTQS
jgi:DNA-binding HxlR family transcriptional regulator